MSEFIDRQEIPGITGGALDSDEGSPGPLLIQGDHGPIEFRKLAIHPAKPIAASDAIGVRLDDHRLVEFARSASAEDVQFSRMTSVPFLMDDLASKLCAPAVAVQDEHDPHAERYCHVYVNDIGKATLQSGNGRYPRGSVIVKQKYRDHQCTHTELFTLMRKVGNGYDQEHGDWEYAVVDGAAERVLSRGKIDSCIACHEDYQATDYVTRLYVSSSRSESP